MMEEEDEVAVLWLARVVGLRDGVVLLLEGD